MYYPHFCTILLDKLQNVSRVENEKKLTLKKSVVFERIRDPRSIATRDKCQNIRFLRNSKLKFAPMIHSQKCHGLHNNPDHGLRHSKDWAKWMLEIVRAIFLNKINRNQKSNLSLEFPHQNFKSCLLWSNKKSYSRSGNVKRRFPWISLVRISDIQKKPKPWRNCAKKKKKISRLYEKDKSRQNYETKT